jgi:hypothetical protein
MGQAQEAKYVERWPNTTSAWAGWSRFDIPVDRYGGVHPLLAMAIPRYFSIESLRFSAFVRKNIEGSFF